MSGLRLHVVGVVSTLFVSSVSNEFVMRFAVSTKTEYSPCAQVLFNVVHEKKLPEGSRDSSFSPDWFLQVD